MREEALLPHFTGEETIVVMIVVVVEAIVTLAEHCLLQEALLDSARYVWCSILAAILMSPPLLLLWIASSLRVRAVSALFLCPQDIGSAHPSAVAGIEPPNTNLPWSCLLLCPSGPRRTVQT